MVTIRNKKVLITSTESQIDQKSRRLALTALEAALEAADPKAIIESKVTLKKQLLTIDRKSFDLNRFENIYVVGGGKASGHMAETLEKLLGDSITRGTLNILHGTKRWYNLDRIVLNEANHPLPDEAGMEGAKRIMDLATQATEKDLVICLLSGGASSLMPLPCKDVTLDEKKILTKALLSSGATINEINTVRKHISGLKGGWLARKAYPATVISLILSDVVGDPLDIIASGPTVPDPSTFGQAIQVLKNRGLWTQAPESIKRTLLGGKRGQIVETPKPDDVTFERVHNFVVGNNRTACLAVCDRLRSAGLKVLLLTSYVEGEAEEVGTFLGAIAQEIIKSGNPISKPCAVVVGGETTVKVAGQGIGGRNQEIALGAALKIAGLDRVVVASINTDGLDGPTDAAGALIDGKLVSCVREVGLEVEDFLRNNNSYTLLSKLNSLIFTGFTGTNVNDISLLIIR